MAKIEQVGYDFRYHFKKNGIPVEEFWSFERVVGYISAIEASRQLSQRYVKAATFCSRLGMTYYELVDFDRETNLDLNKMTLHFSSILFDRSKTDPSFLGKPLADLLDMLEEEIHQFIEEAEKPIPVFGTLVEPGRFLSRPTKEEYEIIVQKKKERADKMKRELDAQIQNGVLNKRIKVSFGDSSRLCRVTKVTNDYLYLNVYDESGVCVQNNMRIPKTSTRFLSKFY